MQHHRSKQNVWNTQDAKAKFSQLVRSAESQDQLITHRGDPTVVMISKKRYDQLTKKPGSLVDFFKKAPLQDVDLNLKREKDFPRELDL